MQRNTGGKGPLGSLSCNRCPLWKSTQSIDSMHWPWAIKLYTRHCKNSRSSCQKLTVISVPQEEGRRGSSIQPLPKAKGKPQYGMESCCQGTSGEDHWCTARYWKRRKHSRGSYEGHAKVFGVVYLGSSWQWSLKAWEAVLRAGFQQSVLRSGISQYFHYWHGC